MRSSPLEERFWTKVAKREPHECWLWTASTKGDGYGALRRGERTVFAHRVSWEIHNGAVPSGFCVLHKCDTPLCVNPGHLFLGTQLENARDREAKGRRNAPRGEKNGLSRLTAERVRAIRQASGTERAIAAQFGIGHSTVHDIRSGKNWKHVQ